MTEFLLAFVQVLSALVALLSVVFLVEVMAARFGAARLGALPDLADSGPDLRFVVVMPAHDEASVIVQTLKVLASQVAQMSDVLVVADNCSDDTASLARACGARVVERHDPTRRGKGYALDFGVRALEQTGYDVLIVFDADCMVSRGALSALARMSFQRQGPVQASYQMLPKDQAGVQTRIAALAWCFKNQIRPLGLRQLGAPCQLQGSGMAFPRSLAQSLVWGDGALVEDMQLGLSCARNGAPPSFAPQVEVLSFFPESAAARKVQRERWEHGHLGLIMKHALPGMAEGIRSGRVGLVALCLDLLVPPLALLVLLSVAVTTLGGALALAHVDTVVLALGVLAWCCLGAGVLSGWLQCGRGVFAASDFMSLPGYVLSKIGLYLRFLSRRQKHWLRTPRDEGADQ